MIIRENKRDWVVVDKPLIRVDITVKSVVIKSYDIEIYYTDRKFYMSVS